MAGCKDGRTEGNTANYLAKEQIQSSHYTEVQVTVKHLAVSEHSGFASVLAALPKIILIMILSTKTVLEGFIICC